MIDKKYYKKIAKSFVARAENKFDTDLKNIDFYTAKNLPKDLERALWKYYSTIPPASVFLGEKVIVMKLPHFESKTYFKKTLSHEFGHLVDFLLGKKLSGGDRKLSDLEKLDFTERKKNAIKVDLLDTEENVSNLIGKIIRGEKLNEKEKKFVEKIKEKSQHHVQLTDGLLWR